MSAAESAPMGSRESSAAESDVDLVTRARSGDRPAFALLYARHAASVHGICLASGPIDEANDLVQEVFLSALRAIDQLEDPTRLGAWLVTIARNRARDALRERGRVVPIDTSASIETHASSSAHARSDDEEDSEAREVLGAIQ